ncbi:MAG: peptidoglycan-binding protein [Actinomycetia bacterium]|nr:peptidoglycan-binding protein [Actinomycetes bacterium]
MSFPPWRRLAATSVLLGLVMPAVAHAAPARVSDLVATGPSGSVAPGTTAIFTAHANGNGATPWYQFWVETEAGWQLARDYGPDGTLTLTDLAPGSYVVVVYALDAGQVAAGEWSAALSRTFVLNVASRVTLTVPAAATAGRPVTLGAQASHLIDPVYQWWWEDPAGQWHASGDYAPAATFTWTPGMAGTYHVVVYAKDPLAPNNATDAVWSTVATLTVRPLTLAYGSFSLTGTTPGHAWYDLRTHAAQLSAIAPLWYRFDPNAPTPLSATADAATMATVTAFARAHGVRVWPCVTAAGPVPDAWWSSPSAAALVATLVTTAAAQGYQGYVLDWETVAPGQAEAFAAFVGRLAAALHAAGASLTVDVLPPPNAAYDLPALAAAADYVDLLAYPEYTTATPSAVAPNPGPTAGAPWVARALQAALAGVPASHLLLGISPYGQSWTYTNAGFQGGTAIPDRTIAANLAAVPAPTVWDPVQQEAVISTGPTPVVPPAPLAPNPGVFSPAVQHLQFLLNQVLLRYAVDHGLPPPAPLATDGGYGPLTAAAVAAFQQDYGLAAATPGVYDASTAARLQSVVDADGIGDTVTWDENTRAAAVLLGLAADAHVGGMSLWRLGYQAPDFWPMLACTPFGP